MNKIFSLSRVIMLIIFPVLVHGQFPVYSVEDVYSDPTLQNGDTINVNGYYTDNERNLLMEFYGDSFCRTPLPAHSIIKLTGIDPPFSAWYGGYSRVLGIISFLPVANPYHPEDSIMAYLEAIEYIVLIPGGIILNSFPMNMENQPPEKKPQGQRESIEDCDPCKFAFLLSGGVDDDNNLPAFWEDLVALYEYKVNSEDYCDSNVFVHYYDGEGRDDRIPDSLVREANQAEIDNSFQTISERIAECNRNGTPATLQKMVSNHGADDGSICLTGDEVLTPEELRDLQQQAIDSCCRTIYEELTECYGGIVIDSMESIDIKNKTTIHMHSAADNGVAWGTEQFTSPYLEDYIESRQAGNSDSRAAVDAKLSYDEFLQEYIDDINEILDSLYEEPPSEEVDEEIENWIEELESVQSGICHSRNVTIFPFTYYCQWQELTVPPGGQLVVHFSEGGENCGNVTVYKQNDDTGELVKVAEWNWNNPDSFGYEPGNDDRVINGDETGVTTFWIHNDDGTSRITAEALGSQILPESISNGYSYPGFSFGGHDHSSGEFLPFVNPFYFLDQIDQMNLSLNLLPAFLGTGFVEMFGFTFMIDPTDLLWSDMQLVLQVNEVLSADNMLMITSSGSIPETMVVINGPGQYLIPLGNFSNSPYGFIHFIPQGSTLISLDCWGFRTTLLHPPVFVSTWTGINSSDWNDPLNWADGMVPGMNHEVVIMPGPFQPVISFDVMIKKLAIMEGAAVITAPGAFLIISGK